MMAAYQPQPGGMHPGMPAHGHPGMAQTPGGHMGQPMMHPGVSGPNQQHVAQAGPMMGMQPGGMGAPGMPGGHHPGNVMGIPGQPGPGQGMGGQGMAGGAPNAHAMNHLNAQQQQQQQMMQQQQLQQQQQMQGNNQMVLQQHQAQLMRLQALRTQAIQMGIPHAGTMSVQQLQQLAQQNQPGLQQAAVQLPPHMLQQQQAIHRQQQAQQQQQQAQAAQQNQAHLQQMAMQHANSQQSHQGQPGPANQQGQPGNPPQMRPQSRMANPSEQAQGAQPPQPQGPAQGQAQPQNAQQGQPQQPGQMQQQMQQMTPQQIQNIQIQRRQQAMQQQQARAMMAQHAVQGPQQNPLAGQFILKIMLLADQLSSFTTANGKSMADWNEFVDRYFAPDGRLLHRFDDGDQNIKTKTYEVLRPTIARYFWTYFESGASSLRLHTENARESIAPGGRYYVSCSNATLTVSYPSGARLEMHGSLNVLFSPASSFVECLDIQQTRAVEIVSRAEIEKVLSTFSPTLSTKSPKLAKNKLPKAQQKLQQQFDGLTIDHFPKAPKGSMGVTSRVQQFLEIGETMNVMSELMSFANEKSLRPDQALETLVQQYEAQAAQPGNPQINLPQNGIAMNQRTPSMGHMQMPQQGGNFSPSVSNLNLPNGMTGSPHIANNPGLSANMMQANSHTPSPHQSNMAAPMMMPQHSQQGTNSSAASANTSPNTNNKRRRSTVKQEDDGPDGQQGQRVKPSPRMTKKAKPGG